MPDIVINEGSLVNVNVAEVADANDLNVLVPETATEFEESLLSKKRGCRARENTTVTIQMTMRNKDGNAIDLTQHNIGGSSSSSSSSVTEQGSVQIRFREGSLVVSTTYAVTATVLSATAGLVSCTVPSEVTALPGVWLVEAGALDADDNLLFTDEAYIYVEHSAWTTTPGTKGPPTIDDVRLSLRDSSPFENELIDDYDFDIAEIASAAIRAVQFWNEQPPPVPNAVFSTHSFPFREIWLQGIQLFLFQAAEEHYRRNHFKHSAGGVVTDDKNRHNEYNSAWKERMATFRNLVIHNKARINASNAYGSFGASYGHR
jgi:hypothetical protein